MKQYIVTAIISSLISILVFAIILLNQEQIETYLQNQEQTGTYLPFPNTPYIVNTKTGVLIKKSQLARGSTRRSNY